MDSFFVFSAQYLFVLPLAILGVYFLKRPRADWKKLAVFALSSALLTYLIGFILGGIIFDPRPFVVGHFTPLLPHLPDNGFPSDHTLLVSALAAIGIYWNKKLGAALWAIAIIVAAARVYVGLHHLLDVVGSAVIALAATAIVWSVFESQTRGGKIN